MPSTDGQQSGPQRIAGFGRWLRTTTTGVVILSAVLGSVVGQLVVPFSFAVWFQLGVTSGIRHTAFAARHPNIAARASTYSLSVPEWFLAIALGWLLGRFVRQRVLLACAVCTLS